MKELSLEEVLRIAGGVPAAAAPFGSCSVPL
jgi:hypothetical protein